MTKEDAMAVIVIMARQGCGCEMCCGKEIHALWKTFPEVDMTEMEMRAVAEEAVGWGIFSRHSDAGSPYD